eukprot:TRINITY_DN2232_c0_g1_i1.p1 TRINITY_DN2232_c0_g1~~TRINITY_DN2232_c0_g1_i1.p1  ORF type:complete len:384 (-),score=87.04 TRINITY_DN2232_c0_g1_i1:101-1252(-)
MQNLLAKVDQELGRSYRDELRALAATSPSKREQRERRGGLRRRLSMPTLGSSPDLPERPPLAPGNRGKANAGGIRDIARRDGRRATSNTCVPIRRQNSKMMVPPLSGVSDASNRPPSRGLIAGGAAVLVSPSGSRGGSKEESQARQEAEEAKKREALELKKREAEEAKKIRVIAHEEKYSADFVKQAYDMFKKYGSFTQPLSRYGFTKILCLMEGANSEDDLPLGTLESAFQFADKDKNGDIDFSEFLAYFATRGFREEFALNQQEREARMLCREYDMNVCDVDRYKQLFAKFDADGSGYIDQFEFQQLIRSCARVDDHIEIPQQRFKQLWKVCDLDGSGEVDFREFLQFYKKYFDQGSGSGSKGSVFEDYYRNLREVPVYWG